MSAPPIECPVDECAEIVTCRVQAGSFDGAHYSTWTCTDHIRLHVNIAERMVNLPAFVVWPDGAMHRQPTLFEATP